MEIEEVKRLCPEFEWIIGPAPTITKINALTLLQALAEARKALEPFAEYAKAIPDSWKETQCLTIALDMPYPHNKRKSGGTILDISVGAEAFRNALKALPKPPVVKEGV